MKAYVSISTDHEGQQSSYEVQVDYYTNYTNGCEDREFVFAYVDEGSASPKNGIYCRIL